MYLEKEGKIKTFSGKIAEIIGFQYTCIAKNVK